MRDSTTATVRKIRDGAGGTVGAFLFQPSATAGLPGGEPDRLLGFPHYSSSNVAAMGSDAKVLAFGDMSRFVAREVRGFRLERSTDVYFAKNQTAVRGLTRTDSALTDVTAINYLHQAVT
jgi:HK97 family phage major capsid protein